MICHYWYFLDKNFKNEPYLCNGCHDLMQKAMNFVNSLQNYYRIHFWYMNKVDTLNITKNFNLNEKSEQL